VGRRKKKETGGAKEQGARHAVGLRVDDVEQPRRRLLRPAVRHPRELRVVADLPAGPGHHLLAPLFVSMNRDITGASLANYAERWWWFGVCVCGGWNTDGCSTCSLRKMALTMCVRRCAVTNIDLRDEPRLLRPPALAGRFGAATPVAARKGRALCGRLGGRGCLPRAKLGGRADCAIG
jgi:hypothetical protein